MTTIYISLGILLIFIAVIAFMVRARQLKNEAWQEFATEIGGEFIKGGFMRAGKVEAHYKEWSLTLDTYKVSTGESSETYTRIKAPFQNKDGLEFTLAPRNILTKLDKILGTKEIEIGDAEFDHNFVIRGKDEPKLRAFFGNMQIRQMIAGQRSIHLSIKDNNLTFHTKGEIRDVERLRTLFELFKEMLNQLNG